MIFNQRNYFDFILIYSWPLGTRWCIFQKKSNSFFFLTKIIKSPLEYAVLTYLHEKYKWIKKFSNPVIRSEFLVICDQTEWI